MSPGAMGPLPKPTEDLKDTFRGLVPAAEGVTVKPMFGNLAGFVNGNMFCGLFGEKLFVRVGQEDREKIRASGGADFAPMAGRPMTGYVCLPDDWRSDDQHTRKWVDAALAQTARMPPKEKKPKRT